MLRIRKAKDTSAAADHRTSLTLASPANVTATAVQYFSYTAPHLSNPPSIGGSLIPLPPEFHHGLCPSPRRRNALQLSTGFSPSIRGWDSLHSWRAHRAPRSSWTSHLVTPQPLNRVQSPSVERIPLERASNPHPSLSPLLRDSHRCCCAITSVIDIFAVSPMSSRGAFCSAVLEF